MLRLHWDEDSLLDFATRRIRIVYDVPDEAAQRIWNSRTTGSLRGRAGFRNMLRLTLYRPRDLLLLLNETFRIAKGGSLSVDHARKASRQISDDRLEDLLKEYGAIIPALDVLVSAFEGKQPEWAKATVFELLHETMTNI